MKLLIVPFILVSLALLTTSVLADRICPEGKSYRADLCKEVVHKPDGTVEIYPVGKSYQRESTMVGKEQADGSMRFCPKGKSYKRDECWVMR